MHEHDRRRSGFGLLTPRSRLGAGEPGKGKRRAQHGSAAEQHAAGRAILQEPLALAHHSPRHFHPMLANAAGGRYACHMSICYVDSPVGRLAIETDHDAVTSVRWTSATSEPATLR